MMIHTETPDKGACLEGNLHIKIPVKSPLKGDCRRKDIPGLGIGYNFPRVRRIAITIII
jgi:hypothetical protein